MGASADRHYGLGLVLIGVSFAAADFRVMLVGGVIIWTWAAIVTAHLLPGRQERAVS